MSLGACKPVPLVAYAGWERSIEVTLEDPETGAAVDITGATIRMQARKSDTSPVVVDIGTDTSGIVITDGANGVFTLTFTVQDPSELVYDVFITGTTLATGLPILFGTIKVLQPQTEAM